MTNIHIITFRLEDIFLIKSVGTFSCVARILANHRSYMHLGYQTLILESESEYSYLVSVLSELKIQFKSTVHPLTL